MRIKVGQKFWIQRGNDRTRYVLAQVKASQLSLINIKDGNRWHDPVSVDDINNVSDDEWAKISAGAKTEGSQKNLVYCW
jgi:hypothetical protein